MTQTTERVDVETLASVAPGTAYVSRVVVDDGHTLVSLVYPHGRGLDVVVPAVPSTGVRAVVHPLAVRVTRSGAALTCSVLHRPGTGPARRAISLPDALALASAGVHTVFSIS